MGTQGPEISEASDNLAPHFLTETLAGGYRMVELSLRSPESIYRHIRDIAKAEGVSINQLISSAITEKFSPLMTEDYLKKRAERANMLTDPQTRRSGDPHSRRYPSGRGAAAGPLGHGDPAGHRKRRNQTEKL
jgi:hypothetical protein